MTDDSEARDLVRMAVAKFIQREADRRRCRVKDLAPMVEDAFDLALEGMRLGDERAHQRETLVEPRPIEGVFSERQTDRNTPVVNLWEGRDEIPEPDTGLWSGHDRPSKRK